jgi:hypothetical protein
MNERLALYITPVHTITADPPQPRVEMYGNKGLTKVGAAVGLRLVFGVPDQAMLQ